MAYLRGSSQKAASRRFHRILKIEGEVLGHVRQSPVPSPLSEDNAIERELSPPSPMAICQRCDLFCELYSPSLGDLLALAVSVELGLGWETLWAFCFRARPEAKPASRAISRRRSGVSFLRRAFPPRRPRAAACGFLRILARNISNLSLSLQHWQVPDMIQALSSS